MSEFGGFLVYQQESSVQPMSLSCNTPSGLEACRSIKEALEIPLDFSKFEILCNCNDIVRFRIEGPLTRDAIELILKTCKKEDQNDGKLYSSN